MAFAWIPKRGRASPHPVHPVILSSFAVNLKPWAAEHPGPPGRSAAKNEVANQPQEVELGTGWFRLLFFRPCRVGGSNGQTNTFFGFSVGWV